jgi:hypothetical protein
MDSGGAPQGIHHSHLADEGGDLGVDRWTAHPRLAGARSPVLAEAAPLPPEDGVGGHDQEGLPPSGPDPGQPDPKEAIRPAQPGPGHRSLVHGELVAQGEVLQGELAVATAEEREESKQVEQAGDHRAGILSGSEPTINHLAARTGFWRRTGLPANTLIEGDDRPGRIRMDAPQPLHNIVWQRQRQGWAGRPNLSGRPRGLVGTTDISSK